ncbi:MULTISPECIES: pyridoxal phosphate-dependent aminotransferase family protein [unclassified Oceanispirochaeta]|uniref:aminotransferase class I/II-fold pyridoxal phosphate-dependent enzyme n=1 Tax=unclassified Oceanispirochaeta TaxID=2635722 RepID=UPI000E0928F4|nr:MULTISPECIES: pyridoxal phosphate-dependent aminotransferase family protein [unclassified Oceanispirochaeta]MBF9015784.1 pyridoxal phosphate-dependent aminotransferase family protein [Oceanispirochaeta sp. M2]NPD72247.1 pyridoxal phosphate-dependent aminotransferase family protein [Oceanispirochaeta sp. M1]RDG32344.1 pyridoxal phosphate-dependent aminotransferase family protein [Oceanispirochaeta sp. M1]
MSVDIFDKCKTDAGYFGYYRKAGDRDLTRPTMDPMPGKTMQYNGEEVVMWSVNNYIGLAENEEIKAAAAEALQEFGTSSPMGSRMMSGNTQHHQDLEQRLADWSQKEAAYLFNFGYMGVLGIVSSLCGPKDTIVVDKLAHACILDAAGMAKASGATIRYFKHNNMKDLESVLKQVNAKREGGVMILIEGVYGMTGDLADLPGICELKEKYEARLFIDDAHGVGVIGEKGRGAGDFFGVQDKIDLYFGTFAKAFASIGGFVAADQDVVDWIAYNARTQVFAKSLPMVYVKTIDRALDFVIDGDDRRKKMWDNSNKLKAGLKELGYYIGPGESPICSVFTPTGSDDVNGVGVKMVKYLRENKIFVTAVVYPVIPPGLCMFRMIPTTSHTDVEINRTIEVFAAMKKDLGLQDSVNGEDISKINKVYRNIKG